LRLRRGSSPAGGGRLSLGQGILPRLNRSTFGLACLAAARRTAAARWGRMPFSAEVQIHPPRAWSW